MVAGGDDTEVPLIIAVRQGEIALADSWVYVWMRRATRRIIYVGATGLHPSVRVWLHLHHPDPAIGRIAARYPEMGDEAFDVACFPIERELDRGRVKDLLSQRLRQVGLLDGVHLGDASPTPGSSEEDRLAESLVRQISAWVLA